MKENAVSTKAPSNVKDGQKEEAHKEDGERGSKNKSNNSKVIITGQRYMCVSSSVLLLLLFFLPSCYSFTFLHSSRAKFSFRQCDHFSFVRGFLSHLSFSLFSAGRQE